mmetsp:Transcript_19219/g.24939  ORF Transcript_19219/g.24939 Transcript_19219/m.24939 type:complete len:235 (-) Transcript_19219:168-872(-)|eukprot:CAMPEP_0197313720 /NCGR_PEP_ID=MMETSP0891-20130614/29735_1 /TAXON_ID=44058 ORGANISM="Aureoumbra lagunensis, Strain CCMP1510" /NCGR_SAMPLE_ID=MMETSP0891 /ASSEMBLY_ACC=CAM_ASM_000534 /LENGTH=234 /DNA_ID=CAMNT_0042801751 /DNA_START=14 /DNA_END=718 /DNA_ORIENTATION=-
MAPKQAAKRKRRGKELVSSALDEAGATTGDELETVLLELERESERRVKKMRRAMDDMKQSFLNAFQVELVKIPRRVRSMKLRTFIEEYGGSVDEALKRATDPSRSITQISATPRAPMSRPLPASRTARPGETLLSVNGSPLLPSGLSLSGSKVAATVKIKNNTRSRLPTTTTNDNKKEEEAASLFVDTDAGFLSLTQADAIKALAGQQPEIKSTVMSQLSALQADIANVMKSLQ